MPAHVVGALARKKLHGGYGIMPMDSVELPTSPMAGQLSLVQAYEGVNLPAYLQGRKMGIERVTKPVDEICAKVGVRQ